jgi:hypothetical protein
MDSNLASSLSELLMLQGDCINANGRLSVPELLKKLTAAGPFDEVPSPNFIQPQPDLTTLILTLTITLAS